ncbi:hypothetical protein [Mesorhizobium sp. M2A.F.Ca.ET.039.01.1.1]|uniref:hypothetical protein n=1 Tax=Mesorhizobium sp. M2A.F.Ca.ET.039.01.1.1 TaxID=2496746 RepID=UPI000FC9DF8D|nr:hypothetical protein [Mesorhizobium sp. M2A.F.Ca.ET.039.01.1.1]RWX72560.1 hypothetical protein EOA24_00790 [Mesorhizobium sp. M2A.F.Ca.ET.039.01.1.1]
MDGFAINLSDLIAGGRPAAKPAAPRPIPEAQIATLREAFERYTNPCPFKPGDIVTPRKGFGYADAGEPHIVLEVAEKPIRNFEAPADVSNIYSSAFGSRVDFRVASLTDGRGETAIVAYWQESWRHELYKS